jgi:RNA polymerase sigma factor (sigma-70 family)
VRVDRPDPADGPRRDDLESTTELLARIREGDDDARDRLVRRYLGTLKRWAHGRLPARARGLADTDDLVQSTLIRALNRLGSFEPQHEGAFLAYLRKALLSQIRDEIRRAGRRPGADGISEEVAAREPSPVEEAIGRETLSRYEQALGNLSDREQQAVFLRVELGMGYLEIADALGAPTANAARMYVARAVAHLAELMGRDGTRA